MSEWEKTLVSVDTPILEAIQVIDANSMQIAIVVDENRRLMGTATDGDIRRGILKGVALETPVSQVMNPNPTTVGLNESRESILTIMKARKLHQIPVVDDDGRVVCVEILENVIKAGGRKNPVVLMVGGLGSRLAPLTDDCPKPLLKVGNKPLLETIMGNFIEYGFRKFYFCVNYKGEMIKEYFEDGSRWDVDIQYINEKKRMGTAGALGLLPKRPTYPLIVMNGDLLTRVNFKQLLDFHQENRSQATMCVREYNFQIPFGVVKIDKHALMGIEEKPVQRMFVNAGIYVLNPCCLDSIPKNTYYDMPDLFKVLIDKKKKTSVFPIREYWMDIGRIDDYERANGEFVEAFK
ncbi:MAG: nucleotidyltransferase family protein [Acidobacteriota bacterium]